MINIQDAQKLIQDISAYVNNGSPLPPDGDPYYAAAEAIEYLRSFLASLLPPEGETRVLGMSVRIDRSLAPDEIRIEHSGADTLRIIGIGQPELTAAPTPALAREEEAKPSASGCGYWNGIECMVDADSITARAALRSRQSPQAADVFVKLRAIIDGMDCDCGAETDSDHSYESVECDKHLLLDALDEAAAPQPSTQAINHGNVCYRCKRRTDDIDAYTITNRKGSTFWTVDLCIRCRDELLASIEPSPQGEDADNSSWNWVRRIRSRNPNHKNSWTWTNKEAAERLGEYFKAIERARLASAQSSVQGEEAREIPAVWLDAKANPPRHSARCVCINRNGSPFFARHAGNDWLDDEGLLRDPVMYIEIPEARAALERNTKDRN